MANPLSLPTTLFHLPPTPPKSSSMLPFPSSLAHPWQQGKGGRRGEPICMRAYKVEVVHQGVNHVLELEEGESVLEKALEAGIDVPHDCKLGVCMTCPARLEKGTVDQSGGMLSDDVVDKGYALLCVALPLSDCKFHTIPEEELLNLQLVTSNL